MLQYGVYERVREAHKRLPQDIDPCKLADMIARALEDHARCNN